MAGSAVGGSGTAGGRVHIASAVHMTAGADVRGTEAEAGTPYTSHGLATEPEGASRNGAHSVAVAASAYVEEGVGRA